MYNHQEDKQHILNGSLLYFCCMTNMIFEISIILKNDMRLNMDIFGNEPLQLY